MIYQMLPRLWGEGLLRSVDRETLSYLKSLGMTHVWYTGVPRHASGKPFVKGDPGSPYAVSNYYDTNPYLAVNKSKRMYEFESLVRRTHKAGLRVIIDFVPNHVSPDYTDPHGGITVHPWHDYDWTDTRKIDYGDRTNWDRLLAILKFWAAKGVDGFRCDMVELVPAAFFTWAIRSLKADYPDVTFIAEIYEKAHYRRYIEEVGFDLLYDKSGLYDVLWSLAHGTGTARAITWNWQFLGDLQPRMLNFLENHDEERLPCAYAALHVSLLWNTCPFMLYFGEEVGEAAAEAPNRRTSIFDRVQVESLQHLYRYIHEGRGLRRPEAAALKRVGALLRTASDPLYTEGGSYDLCYCNQDAPGFDPDRHFIWLRYHADRAVLILANFSGAPADISVYLPQTGGRVRIRAAAQDGAILPVHL